jgi:hypothetical protein
MTKAVRNDGIDNDCDNTVDEEECYPGLLQGTYLIAAQQELYSQILVWKSIKVGLIAENAFESALDQAILFKINY